MRQAPWDWLGGTKSKPMKHQQIALIGLLSLLVLGFFNISSSKKDLEDMLVGHTWADTISVFHSDNGWYSSNEYITDHPSLQYHEVHYWHFYSVDSLASIQQAITAPLPYSHYFYRDSATRHNWSLTSAQGEIYLFVGVKPFLKIIEFGDGWFEAEQIAVPGSTYLLSAIQNRRFFKLE